MKTTMKKLTGTLLLAVLAAAPARSAEAPRLLADLNTRPVPPETVNAPRIQGFFELGNHLLFSTASYSSDDEGILWSTDGTPEGTEVVSSTICPTPCGGIQPLGKLGNVTLLAAGHSDGGYTVPQQLWRTDGTPSGTSPLTPRLTGISNAIFVQGPSPEGGLLYFVGCRPEDGCEIWRSDGTRAGTGVVKDLVPGRFSSYPRSLVSWAGRLYFLAEETDAEGLSGRFGLWSTDGTADGTRFLSDVQEPYEADSRVVSTPSHLFFSSGPGGEDLWVTDGTPEGARLLLDLEPPGCNAGYPHDCDIPDLSSLVALDDAVYFVTDDQAVGDLRTAQTWRSDGTESGTRPVAQFSPSLYPDLNSLRRLGNRWFFLVVSSSSAALWSAGEGLAHPEPLSGCAGGACPAVQALLPTAPDPGHLLFLGEDPGHGVELWITDGTGAGTRRLTDVCPGPCNGFSATSTDVDLGSFQGRTYLHAIPSTSTDPYPGDDLWVTDGTPEGTRRVAGYTPSLYFFHDRAYFGTSDSTSTALWTTDGTPSGTRQVIPVRRYEPGSVPQILATHAGALILAYDGTHQRLWRSNGTPEGMVPLAGFESAGFGYTSRLTPAGDLSFFDVVRLAPGRPDVYQTEIWRTNGTSRGTRRVGTLPQGSYTDLKTGWNGKLLFLVGGPGGCAFWSSDGTPAGTREILAMPPGARCPTAVRAFGSGFLFVTRVLRAEGLVPQVFLSDGTPEGTRQISNIRGFREPLFGAASAMTGGTAFFPILGRTAEDTEIWRTDGTPAGTRRAFKAVQPGDLYGFRGSLYFTAAVAQPYGQRGLWRVSAKGGTPLLLAFMSPYEYSSWTPSFPNDPHYTPVADRLFYVAEDEGGYELWVTNGTPQGTRRVLDIRPGPDGSFPAELTAAGDRIFFTANDGQHGRELWVSDGTPEGTRLVWDLNPSGFASNPTSLAVSGDRLFFAADDGHTGFEPWVLPLTPR